LSIKKKSRKEQESHEENGSTPITPHDLILVRNYLIGSNDLANYQLWVLILFCSRLFLRSQEATGHTVDKKTGIKIPTGMTIESFNLNILKTSQLK
jgi:hypothetical protein